MSTFSDPQAEAALAELRKAIKHNAPARALLDQLVSRLAYVARLGRQWDATHAEQAETHLRLGNVEGARLAAGAIFDPEIKQALLARVFAATDQPAVAVAAADDDWLFAEMREREVLE